MNKRVLLVVKIAVSLGLLAALVWLMGGVRPMIDQMAQLNLLYALAVIGVLTVDRVLMTYKWGLLLRAVGVRLPLWRGVRVYCASMIWGMFLPSTVGADAIRIYAVSRDGHDGARVAATVVMERLLGFLAALVMGVAALGALWWVGVVDRTLAPAAGVAALLLLAGMAMLACSLHDGAYRWLHDRVLARWREAKLAHKLRRFHESFGAFRRRPGVLSAFLGLSLVEQLTPILHCWLLAKGMGIEVGLLFFTGAVPLSVLLSRLPISVDGLGVFDAAFAALLAWAGATPAEALAIAFAGRITQTAAYLPWWVWQWLDAGRRPAKDQTARPPVGLLTPDLKD